MTKQKNRQPRVCVVCTTEYTPNSNRQSACGKACAAEWSRAKSLNYYHKHKDDTGYKQKRRGYVSDWMERNRDRRREWKDIYYKSDHYKVWRRAESKRRRKDPLVRLADNARSRASIALRKLSLRKTSKTLAMIGIDASGLMRRLLAMADPASGFTESNYGSEWVMDHIRPLASYDLRDPEQALEAFHYTNIQAMSKVENMKKNARWNGVLHTF